MPLRDHFHSPVNDTHSWDEVHGQWPGEIVRHLATILPTGFRAAPKVHLGAPFEVDIGSFELDTHEPEAAKGVREGGVATLSKSLAPTFAVEAAISEQDEYEVRIYDVERGRTLVAVIEIVSPSNKDRPGSREVFASKVLSLLQQGICVSLVDPVTVRVTNLYVEVLALLGLTDPAVDPAVSPPLYAVTIRGRTQRKRPPLLEAWYHPMTLGQPLPTLPIWLSPESHVLLPLETSYEESCRILGIRA